MMKSTGFHEIHLLSWNQPDFMMTSARFHEICWISWNLPDFMMPNEPRTNGPIFLFVGLHCICWNFKVRQSEEKKNKKTTDVLASPSGVLYYVSDNFKKVWDMLTRQLRPWFFYLLDYIASAEISKCGDQKNPTDVLVNSSRVLYYNFSKKK